MSQRLFVGVARAIAWETVRAAIRCAWLGVVIGCAALGCAGEEASLLPGSGAAGAGTPAGGGGAGTCSGGTTPCGDACVDTTVDPDNCGDCGNACTAVEICSAGQCCPAGQKSCGGTCVDIATDAANCGDCDEECDAATPVCSAASCRAPYASCLEYLAGDPGAATGVYTIDPDGDGPAASLEVYCDMTTDGGGWTLVLAYAHAAGQNAMPVAGAPPLDPGSGFGHASLAVMQLLPFDELRLYCETGAHARKMHFKTAGAAVAYFRGEMGNAVSYWTTGFTALPGHAANLPAATDHVFDRMGEDRMTEFPFYASGVYHWGIAGGGTRWECDDFAGGPQNTTLHQVWVR